MPKQFRFADAMWFRVPLKVLVISISVFGLVSLYPALVNGASADHDRAILGLTVLLAFVVTATVFTVAINDSYVEIDREAVSVRFESFFSAQLPIRDIVRVTSIDPRPRFRYRLGLTTNFRDRISCSHGGALIEIELRRAQPMRLWPRQILVTRFWLAVREHDAFIAALRERVPDAFERARDEAA